MSEEASTAEQAQPPEPESSGAVTGYAAELTEIAKELEGLSGHIKDFLAGSMTTLPMLWDIQEVVIRFKNVTTKKRRT